MTIKKIKSMAKERGVQTRNLNKTEIIRAIQKAEGNFDCYGTAISGNCDQTDCLWREDCLSMK